MVEQFPISYRGMSLEEIRRKREAVEGQLVLGKQPEIRTRTEHKPIKLTRRARLVRTVAVGVLAASGIYGGVAKASSSHNVEKAPENKPVASSIIIPEQQIKSDELSQKTYEAFLNNKKFMERLNKNMDVYKEAAKDTGVDWKILAAIHYREAEMDPSHSLLSGEKLGTKNPDSGIIYKTLEDSADTSAAHAKEMLSDMYRRNLDNSPDTLKRLFLAYNRGGLYIINDPEELPVEVSPYVMNFYNKDYQDMKWPNEKAEPENLRGQKDGNYGAFTVYKILEQAESEGKL